MIDYNIEFVEFIGIDLNSIEFVEFIRIDLNNGEFCTSSDSVYIRIAAPAVNTRIPLWTRVLSEQGGARGGKRHRGECGRA